MRAENNDVMVTLVCITYNQEDYIAEALDSFISQKTNFTYKVFVGDDCSSDRTPEIVMEYAEKYPDIIVPFIRKENMGAQRNLVDMCSQAKSRYIAFCEGDDYLINENKLQIQYDYMESHPTYRACFHNTEIKADPDWYLNSYYKANKNGQRLIPYSIPGYNKKLRSMKMDYYIQYGPAHTSSMFFRWDYDLKIPDWYYNHIFGDHPMMMLQAGDGTIGFIPQVMSVYRRSEVGVIMYNNKNEHFLKTRESWMDVLLDLENYFTQMYGDFCNAAIRRRMVQEGINYLSALNEHGLYDRIVEYIHCYPQIFDMSINTLMNNRKQIRKLNHLLSKKVLTEVEKEPKYVKNYVKQRMQRKHRVQKIKTAQSRLWYWLDGLRRKKKNLWVFTGTKNETYNNNTRHLFEYIVAYHPEIKPMWITSNSNIVKLFESSCLPVCLKGSKQAKKVLRKAGLVFTNNFVVDDYKMAGFNCRTKVVQLGIGVSMKNFENSKKMNSLAFKQYKKFNCLPKDSFKTRMKKKLLRIRAKMCIENYNEYFMMLVQNTAMCKKFSELFHLDKDRFFICGAPRTNPVIDHIPSNGIKKVLYAPEISSSRKWNDNIVNNFIKNQKLIDSFGEKNGFDLYIYLPYQVLKIYKVKLEAIELNSEHIKVVRTNDFYTILPDFDVMITDFSDHFFDFILMDKPVVFMKNHNDMERIKGKLALDYDAYTPGVKTENWGDSLVQVRTYLADPTIDSVARQKIVQELYENNSENNSEQIINELIKRLHWKIRR